MWTSCARGSPFAVREACVCHCQLVSTAVSCQRPCASVRVCARNADARSDVLNDLEFDVFERFVGTKYAEKGEAPSAEEVREFGRALNVVDYNPPIDPRLPRFDRVRDSLGKALPF